MEWVKDLRNAALIAAVRLQEVFVEFHVVSVPGKESAL